MIVTDLRQIDDQISSWMRTSSTRHDIDIQIENLALKIVLTNSYKIYLKGSPTPGVTPKTLNVSSDDSVIQKLFKDHFPESGLHDGYRKIGDTVVEYTFNLRFYPSKEALEKHLMDEEVKYQALTKEPKHVNCVLI